MLFINIISEMNWFLAEVLWDTFSTCKQRRKF